MDNDKYNQMHEDTLSRLIRKYGNSSDMEEKIRKFYYERRQDLESVAKKKLRHNIPTLIEKRVRDEFR